MVTVATAGMHRRHLGGGGGGGPAGAQPLPPTFPHYFATNATLLLPAIPVIQYC